MTDVTVDEITRRGEGEDIFVRISLFSDLSRDRNSEEGRIRFSESRRGGEKGRRNIKERGMQIHSRV